MQAFPRKRYRFIYPAGLISLVLLPLLGVLYLYSKPAFEQKYAMEVNTISLEDLKSNSPRFPNPAKIRHYEPILLTGNKIEDENKLKLFQLSVRDMLANKDTINGVQVIYGSKAKYGSFVQCLNICHIENARYWALVNNNFYVLYRNPIKENYFRSFCGTPEIQAYYDRLRRREEELEYSKLHPFPSINLITSIKTFWPAFILYLIMLSLTTKKVVSQLQTQQRTTSNQQL